MNAGLFVINRRFAKFLKEIKKLVRSVSLRIAGGVRIFISVTSLIT